MPKRRVAGAGALNKLFVANKKPAPRLTLDYVANIISAYVANMPTLTRRPDYACRQVRAFKRLVSQAARGYDPARVTRPIAREE